MASTFSMKLEASHLLKGWEEFDNLEVNGLKSPASITYLYAMLILISMPFKNFLLWKDSSIYKSRLNIKPSSKTSASL